VSGPLSVAVIAGGPSREAAVSRTSAAGVAGALDEAGHRVRTLELDASLPEALAREPLDVVFPITHGPVGEDGCLQGLLEVLDLPYVGSGVLASALAMSKPHAKRMFRAAALPVTEDREVVRGDDLEAAVRSLRAELGAALVVKPASGGSAIGVSRVAAEAPDGELRLALERALADGQGALVEPFVRGAEVTCGVLDEPGGARAFPPTLILSVAADWYDFTSRYAAGGSEHRCPAPLPEAVTRRVQQVAVAAHRALGARDLSRVDFVVADSEVVLLEVNTLPGMTPTSLYPEAAAAAGIAFPELCDRLVRRAQARPRRERVVELPMP
jgi:D-alanine-D-alanine ligase